MEPNIFFDLQAHHFQQQQNRRQIKPRTYGDRSDPRVMMTEQEFKRHFRLNKDSVTRLCELLKDDLKFKTERGKPIPPIVQVCITLNHYAGGHFQRISAWYGGVSQNGARLSPIRVTEALVKRKEMFVFMPDSDTMLKTAERMQDKLKLPRFSVS